MTRRIMTVLLLSCLAFCFCPSVSAANLPTENDGARYLVNNIMETNELPFGVRHTKIDCFTSTSLTGYDADGLGGSSASVVPGKYYEQKINALEVPSIQGVKITTWGNVNNHIWNLSTVKNLIKDYEKKHPGWEVIGAVNADGFDINGTKELPYSTSGVLCVDGEYYKSTTFSARLLGFTNDGSVNSMIVKPKEEVPKDDYMKLTIYGAGDKIIFESDIQKRNSAPGKDGTSIYFAYYDEAHTLLPADFTVPAGASCFVVEEAELALPTYASDFYGRGVISSVTPQQLKKGQFALVTNNNMVKTFLKIGAKVRCQRGYGGEYENIKNITGCFSTVLEDSIPYSDSKLANRAPRTIIGRKPDGTVVLAVVDGRQASLGMYGTDHSEMGAIMKGFGCIDAYNLDGGGSSTFIIKKAGEYVILNSPSDGWERSVGNCILVVTKTPTFNCEFQQKGSDLFIETANLEAAGHDIESLYIDFGGRLKKLEMGTTVLTDLRSNTEYHYYFKYRDKNGRFIALPYDGKMTTLKCPPVINKFEVFESESDFKILLYYDDPDNALIPGDINLIVNGQNFSVVDGQADALKQICGRRLDTLLLIYNFDLNDGEKTKEMEVEEFILASSSELDILFSVTVILEEMIISVYR